MCGWYVDGMCGWCVVSSQLQQDLYSVRHEREMSTVQEIHAMLQAHVQLLDQVGCSLLPSDDSTVYQRPFYAWLARGGLAAEWLACWTQAQKARFEIAATTLSGNSLRQTVHTHRASVHQAATLVAALLRFAGVNCGSGGK